MALQVNALRPSSSNGNVSNSAFSRRGVLNQSILLAGGMISAGKSEEAMGMETGSSTDTFQAYKVLPDTSEALNPQLQELKVRI